MSAKHRGSSFQDDIVKNEITNQPGRSMADRRCVPACARWLKQCCCSIGIRRRRECEKAESGAMPFLSKAFPPATQAASAQCGKNRGLDLCDHENDDGRNKAFSFFEQDGDAMETFKREPRVSSIKTKCVQTLIPTAKIFPTRLSSHSCYGTTTSLRTCRKSRARIS